MSSIPQESEVQALQQELVDTRKKLQDYGDTIVSLHSELRTLRNSICDTCKRRFILANVESSQDAAGSSFIVNHPHCQVSPEDKNPSLQVKRPHAFDYPPNKSRFHQSKILNYFMRNSSQTPPPKRSQPSYTPPPPRVVAVHDKPVPLLNQHISSSKAILQKNEPNVSRWSAERDAAADATLEVTFVRAFINKDSVYSVRFSPDGNYLAAALRSISGATVIYDVVTGEQTCVLAENRSQYSTEESPSIWCLSFSPDGRYLVVGDIKYRVMVWDIRNKRIRNVFRGHSQSLRWVNFSPNGRFVLSLSWDDRTMRLWNLRDGSAKILPDTEYIWSAAFSPNGQYIAAGNTNGMFMIWDVRTVRIVRRWIGEGQISRVVFTPDGRGLLSGQNDGAVKNWNIGSLEMVESNGGAVPISLEYKGLENWIYGIAVSPDGRWVLSTSEDRKTVIWDARTATRQWTLIGHEELISSLDFSPSGKYLALGSHDRRISLWKYVSP